MTAEIFLAVVLGMLLASIVRNVFYVTIWIRFVVPYVVTRRLRNGEYQSLFPGNAHCRVVAPSPDPDLEGFMRHYEVQQKFMATVLDGDGSADRLVKAAQEFRQATSDKQRENILAQFAFTELGSRSGRSPDHLG